jgi:N-sulfoglucosamine sulfohydrolase
MKLIVFFSIVFCKAGLAQDRPNILFLFADDLGRYASAYSEAGKPSPNDVISTPAFDRIAKEGVIFENAFVSVPSCTPSRAAMVTGRHFFRNGSHSQLHHPWQNGVADPFDGIKGMPMILQDSGYHIGLTYKLHMRESIFGGKGNIYNRAGAKMNQYSHVVSAATDREAKKQEIFAEVRGNFRAFLANRKEKQPFFYAFHPTNTHRAWKAGSGQSLWGIDPEKLKGKMPPTLPDSAVIRADMADYLGEVMAFYSACDVLMRMVEEMGELDNTIVVISGDHGIPGFPRGKCNVHDFGSRVPLAIRWPKRIAAGRKVSVPVSLIDLAPTLLAAAKLTSPDDPDGQNLLPALEEGGDDAKLRGWALIGRETHSNAARDGMLPYPTRALRTAEFLYVKNFKPERWPMGEAMSVTGDSAPSFEELVRNTRCAFADMDGSPTKAWLVEHRRDAGMEPFLSFAWGMRPAEELYELAKDPHQMNNLAGDPKYAETLSTLNGKLMAELRNGDDPRLNGDAFDRPPYAPVKKP